MYSIYCTAPRHVFTVKKLGKAKVCYDALVMAIFLKNNAPMKEILQLFSVEKKIKQYKTLSAFRSDKAEYREVYQDEKRITWTNDM